MMEGTWRAEDLSKIFGEEITKKYAGEEERVEGLGEYVACALSWVLIKQIAKPTV